MKIKWLIVLIPVFVLLGLTGCKTTDNRTAPGKLVAFTGKHLEDFGEYLGEIQFYISRQIVLYRTVTTEQKDVTGKIHTIQIEKNLNVQSITFPAKTPCVLFGFNGDTLNAQFEPAREGRRRTVPFSKKRLISGDDKPENTVFAFDKESLAYDGEEYQVYYEEEDVVVTEKDDTIFAEKARSEQAQYRIKKRFPILLINPVIEIGRVTEEHRVVSGAWEGDFPQ